MVRNSHVFGLGSFLLFKILSWTEKYSREALVFAGKVQFLFFRRFLPALTKFNVHASSHLWRKENLVKFKKFLKYYDHDCSCTFTFLLI